MVEKILSTLRGQCKVDPVYACVRAGRLYYVVPLYACVQDGRLQYSDYVIHSLLVCKMEDYGYVLLPN